MAPEHDARTRAFYDHESDEPSPRRRRAAADWGVNEDIFDRMPSRRFTRSDRRAHHEDFDGHRFERRVSGPSRPVDEWSDGAPRGEDTLGDESYPLRRDDWTDEHERRQIAPRRGDWPDRDDAPRRTTDEPRRTTDEWAAPTRDEGRRDDGRRATNEWAAPTRDEGRRDDGRRATNEWAAPTRDDARRDDTRRTTDDFAALDRADGAAPRRARRPAESWTVTDDHVPVEDGKRSIDSWLAPEAGRELELAPGESRTVVLETMASDTAAVVTQLEEPEFQEAPPARRTVTITGHPDRMPVARAQRPPKTALERIGASPDRIVGYAVLLGFVLVLIAVLTTGQ